MEQKLKKVSRIFKVDFFPMFFIHYVVEYSPTIKTEHLTKIQRDPNIIIEKPPKTSDFEKGIWPVRIKLNFSQRKILGAT